MLILTKQVGTGIVNTAIKGEMASAAAIREAEIVMSSLNKKAKEVVDHFPVNACTDITGFGLLGHCVEMAEASNVTFELNVHDIAYLDEAISYAKMGLVPAGAYKNKGYSYQKVDFRNVEDHFIDLLYDPQTSGGLLIRISLSKFRQNRRKNMLCRNRRGRNCNTFFLTMRILGKYLLDFFFEFHHLARILV